METGSKGFRRSQSEEAKLMLNKEQIADAAFKALHKSAVEIPEDVKNAFLKAQREEEGTAKIHIEKTIENIEAAIERNVPVCPDTGWPMFFIKLGSGVEIEGGYSVIKEAVEEAVAKLTSEDLLRVTMVDPITREPLLENVGSNIPYIDYKPFSGDYLEITAVPKGGGAELFIQTPLRMLLLADGMTGIKKFIVDSVISGTAAGKTCPPNVVGIGIGGTGDLCMKLAKQAALLRPIGNRHPEARIAELEDEMTEALNLLNIGPMGGGGETTVFDVHIEYALTHTAGNPVAVNTQCNLTRRGTVRIYAGGTIESRQLPEWFERSQQ
jgi:fumarate hydratase subunit alpha